MYIRPVVIHYQRTLEEFAEDPKSTINAHEWFLNKAEVILRAIPEGLHQFVRATQLVIDSEYHLASIDNPITIRQITNSLQWLADQLFKYCIMHRKWFCNTDYTVALEHVFFRAYHYLKACMTHHVRKRKNRFSVELVQHLLPEYQDRAYPQHNPEGISGAAAIAGLPTALQGAEEVQNASLTVWIMN